MLNIIARREKDYSRHNLLRHELKDLEITQDIDLLLPFSKKRFPGLRLRGRTIIHDFFISDYDTYANDRKKGSRFSPSAVYKYLLDWISFRFSPYLLSDTQAHFEYWQQLFGRYHGRHMVFPVLADPNRYRPAPEQPDNPIPVILFYGYFIPLHGVDVILQALQRCERRGLQFQARLIGAGQTLPAMRRLADRLNLRQCSFNGRLIAEDELVREIQTADLLLGIFGDSRKALSVVPNKVYQALACERPIITRESPAIREFFTDDELCMVERSPDQLAEAIERLLVDDTRRTDLARQGHARYQSLYLSSVRELKSFIQSIDRQMSSHG